jgi:hypothetical protein
MPPVICALLACLAACFRSRRSIQLEILALRHQLAVYQRSVPKPRIPPADRLLWAWVARVWSGWQTALAVAESVRGTADRERPSGGTRSCHRAARAASEAHSDRGLPVLPSFPYPFVVGYGLPRATASSPSCPRQGHRGTQGGGTPSSLRTPRGLRREYS